MVSFENKCGCCCFPPVHPSLPIPQRSVASTKIRHFSFVNLFENTQKLRYCFELITVKVINIAGGQRL